MAIFLLENAGASVTGDSFILNGGIWNINIEASNYGSALGVILESKLDSSTNFVPLTYLGEPAYFDANKSVILRIASNGFILRARTDLGCSGVTVTALSSGSAY